MFFVALWDVDCGYLECVFELVSSNCYAENELGMVKCESKIKKGLLVSSYNGVYIWGYNG